MPKRRTEHGLLVVVELGGEWPSAAQAPHPSSRRVVAQLEGESPAQFAERVADGLDGLFGRGIRLSSLALACNERLDEQAVLARRKIAGLALGSMAKHRAGRVWLSAAPRSSGKLRHALSALAADLGAEWGQAGLEASVEFGEEARPSARVASYSFTARVA